MLMQGNFRSYAGKNKGLTRCSGGALARALGVVGGRLMLFGAASGTIRQIAPLHYG